MVWSSHFVGWRALVAAGTVNDGAVLIDLKAPIAQTLVCDIQIEADDIASVGHLCSKLDGLDTEGSADGGFHFDGYFVLIYHISFPP